MTSPKKILIVSHEASLTGAPLVAWRLAEFLNKEFSVALVYMAYGQLLKSRPHSTSVILFIPKEINFIQRIKRRFLKIQPTIKYKGIKEIIEFNTDMVCINSIASIPFLFQSELRFAKKSIYIHEMPLAITRYFQMMGYKLSLFNELDFNLIFVVNQITKEFLITEASIPEEKIKIVEPSIDDHFLLHNLDGNRKVKYDILLSGQGGWTKGTDLIPQLAFHLQQLGKNRAFRIAWVGEVERNYIDQIRYELALAGVTNVDISFLGVLADIKSVISESSLFISLSRADAMQTACIEAMAMGKPIICFRGSGGIASLIENKCGLVVAYPDINKVAENVLYLLDDQRAYYNLSETAKKMAKQFSSQKMGAEFAEILRVEF